jgi:hypothetical protein
MRAGTQVDPGGVTTMPEPVSEEKQKAYFEKARKGMLAWLAKQDGATATLGDMHQHSSERYLITHQGFSKLMESLVDGKHVDYDEATGTATLTNAGRRLIES